MSRQINDIHFAHDRSDTFNSRQTLEGAGSPSVVDIYVIIIIIIIMANRADLAALRAARTRLVMIDTGIRTEPTVLALVDGESKPRLIDDPRRCTLGIIRTNRVWRALPIDRHSRSRRAIYIANEAVLYHSRGPYHIWAHLRGGLIYRVLDWRVMCLTIPGQHAMCTR
jgi:hypothetical protein